MGVGIGGFGAICLIATALILKRRNRRAPASIPLQNAWTDTGNSGAGAARQAPQRSRERSRKEHPVDKWHKRVISRDNRRDSLDELW